MIESNHVVHLSRLPADVGNVGREIWGHVTGYHGFDLSRLPSAHAPMNEEVPRRKGMCRPPSASMWST